MPTRARVLAFPMTDPFVDLRWDGTITPHCRIRCGDDSIASAQISLERNLQAKVRAPTTTASPAWDKKPIIVPVLGPRQIADCKSHTDACEICIVTRVLPASSVTQTQWQRGRFLWRDSCVNPDSNFSYRKCKHAGKTSDPRESNFENDNFTHESLVAIPSWFVDRGVELVCFCNSQQTYRDYDRF